MEFNGPYGLPKHIKAVQFAVSMNFDSFHFMEMYRIYIVSMESCVALWLKVLCAAVLMPVLCACKWSSYK